MSSSSVEATARARLRALRLHRGWTLDEVARRANLSASTVSRLETGKRSIGLDVLVPLARALGVGTDELLAPSDDSDVVIRPSLVGGQGGAIWSLSRPGAAMQAMKMRLMPTAAPPDPQVHPGHDWMFVLSGRVVLTLGERQVPVEPGEAAAFSTMTPHAVSAADGPAEVLMVFDRDGERSHLGRVITDAPDRSVSVPDAT